MSKEIILKEIVQEVRDIVQTEKNVTAVMQQICEKLHERIDVYDWVGFYLDDTETERQLILGPYVGPATDHTKIPYGRGICGQVAESHETFVVEDVNQQANYLSCSVNVKSEIVVPVMKNGVFVAQLDIDSNTIAAMDATDQKYLEEICEIIAPLF